MKFNTLLYFIFFTIQINAQSGLLPMADPKVASGYTFLQSVGVYNEINGGTVLGSVSSTNQSYIDPANLVGEAQNLIPGPGLPIGFDFVFNGNTFDRVAVNTNGWLSFGKSSLGNNAVFSQIATAPLSQIADGDANGIHDMSPNSELRNRIAALGTDLNPIVDSDLRIETIGTAPERIFVAQWRKFKKYGSSSIDMAHTYNFQIRLYETTNIVEVVYGDMIFGPVGYSAQVGLSGYQQTDYNNRWVSSSVSSTNSWAVTDAGFSPTTNCHLVATIPPPVSGSIFKWTPVVMSRPSSNFMSLKVYPSNIESVLNIANPVIIEKMIVFDLTGRKFLDESINKSNFSIDVSKLATGTYLIHLTSENQFKSVKFFKM